MITADLRNSIINFKTGERIPLTPQEVKARNKFMADSKVKEAQYVERMSDQMEGLCDDYLKDHSEGHD